MVFCPVPDGLASFRPHFWLIAGPPDAFLATESLSCSCLCFVARTPTLVQPRSCRTKHFGNHNIKRNLQDGLRTCLLDFPERGESCIRDDLHAFGREAEIPAWPN